MIQMQTELHVADNSGARKVECIKVLGGSKKRYAMIGDIIKVSVKDINNHGKVKRGSVYSSVVVRTVRNFRRLDGSFIRFDDNSVVLLNSNNHLIGTRVFGPVTRELRDNNLFLKIVSLASEVL